MIQLDEGHRFSQGGIRVCYVHPEDTMHCLKVLRHDRLPARRRDEKGFPANLRPLHYYDENRIEEQRLRLIQKRYPSGIHIHLPKSFGLKPTSKGIAHETELIRDADGRISETLEQYIWQQGLNSTASRAIANFFQAWSKAPPKTRDFLPHNFVIQLKDPEPKLVLIDGFGRNIEFFGIALAPRMSTAVFAKRKKDFGKRIERVLERSGRNDDCFGRIRALDRNR